MVLDVVCFCVRLSMAQPPYTFGITLRYGWLVDLNDFFCDWNRCGSDFFDYQFECVSDGMRLKLMICLVL